MNIVSKLLTVVLGLGLLCTSTQSLKTQESAFDVGARISTITETINEQSEPGGM